VPVTVPFPGLIKEEPMALPTRIAPAPGDTTTSHASWLMLAVLLLGQFM
jgi:hypothetical protein